MVVEAILVSIPLLGIKLGDGHDGRVKRPAQSQFGDYLDRRIIGQGEGKAQEEELSAYIAEAVSYRPWSLVLDDARLLLALGCEIPPHGMGGTGCLPKRPTIPADGLRRLFRPLLGDPTDLRDTCLLGYPRFYVGNC